MKRKDLIKIIKSFSSISFDKLIEVLNVKKPSNVKKMRKLVSSLIKNKEIVIDGEKNLIISKDKDIEIKNEKPIKKERTQTDKTKLTAQDDFYIITEKYKIRREFSESVLKEAEALKFKKDEDKRLDLRKKMIFTIDGADAKDLDDAVSIEKKSDGWILGVHIADVSFYVQKNSKLDKEAKKRGNSYYFINKVVPMFPFALSNYLCSLNPNEDKLTLSIFINIDKNGEIKGYEILPSIICSKYRLTYDYVESYLKGEVEIKDKNLKKSLDEMNILFRLLNKRRIENGSIDFDFKEQKIELDDKDEPIKVWLKERLDAERIIEEFMLAANKCIAKFLSEKEISLYRVHEEPEEHKLRSFMRMALRLGHKIQGNPIPDAFAIQKILREVKDKPHKELINHILLRSMQQARYQTENFGHYGLGFEFYTHFTSPIRRYADLIVHRLIRYFLFDKSGPLPYSRDELSKIATHISNTERIAMEMEREFYKIKSLRFMKGMEGKKFSAIISGIINLGIFAQIEKYGIEGMIRFADMEDDYYIFDEANYCAIGKKTRKKFVVGDKIKVEVVSVRVEKGFLNLKIVEKNRVTGT
ncbi:MAG: ribonuclease R [Brevinematales bacterium]|nr:ribonuclease R [Brevinematales bacterium]